MKKLLKQILLLAVCAAALCLTAAAVETPAPTRVWGQVSPWEGEGILLKNDNPDDPMNEVVVHLGDAPVVDAATGQPLDVESIKEGATLYAWIGPAATMSLPPQVTAIVAVGNVPADAAAPEYMEIAGEAVVPAPGGDGAARFPTVGGGTLEVTEKTVYSPWLTRQIVRMEDLVPGARALVWKDTDGKAEKVLLFPYSYQGYITMTAMPHGDLRVSLEGAIQVAELPYKKTESGAVLLPIRALAEASGCGVRWDKELGAVVSRNEETVFSVKPGADLIVTPEGEAGLASPCVIEAGVTYLPAEDLAYWLNLFLAG